MIRIPFVPQPRYAVVLTSESLELGSPDPAVAPVVVPLPPGVIGPDPSGDASSCELHDVEALRSALKSALAQLGRPVRQAHLALDGLLIRTVSLPIPFVPPREELELAVRSEAERYRVFAGAEVASDFTMLVPGEDELTVLLAAARRDYIDGVVEVFEGEGISVTSVEPVPFALLRGLATAGASQEACGMVTVFPRQIHVSTWTRDELQTWRTLYVEESALEDGEPVAIAETILELQRSLFSVASGTYFLVNVPAPLQEALLVPDTVALQPLEGTLPDGRTVSLRGALDYGPERGPFVFDLRPDRLKTPRPKVSRGVGLPLAFVAVLILALCANLWLSEQVKRHEAEAERLQAEIATMQAALSQPDSRGESEAALKEALRRSESVVALFQRFQDDTPHDVWLSRTSLGDDEHLVIEGFSLSRQGALNLAQALGQWRSLSDIEVPEVAEAEWEGERVYRFKLLATFVPQGRFKP